MLPAGRPALLRCLQDNGCGMSHADIPNMLGRVLSGTKYGVKQVRGWL
jgi:DNA topoisomerase VI subunit B